MQLRVRQFLIRPLTALWSQMRSACQPYVARAHEALIPLWRRMATWYEKREPREKILLRLLGAVFAVLILYQAVYVPVQGLHENLTEQVAARQHQLVLLRAMMRNYQRLRLELATTQKRTIPGGKDPALFSVLEMTLTNSVGRAKIGSLTPDAHQVPGGFEQYTVQVKLNEIALAQIVDTLYSLQSLNVPITISNLQIHQHAQGSHTFDVDLTCMALGRAS
jgi:type II secretory pathway component PulM